MSGGKRRRNKPGTGPAAFTPLIVCPYCKQADKAWRGIDLGRGKRGLKSGQPGIEYHCEQAYYGGS